MYIWWLLKFLVEFFVENLPNRAAMSELSNWQKLAKKPSKYYEQKAQNFNKTAACSHHCPLWHEYRH